MPLEDLTDEQLAEDAMGYVPPPLGSVRTHLDICILTASTIPERFFSTATALQLPDDPAGFAEAVAQVRAHFGERGVREFTWWIGPSTTPADARDRLVAMGATPEWTGERSTAMVLDHEPSGAVNPGVEVREVRTIEDFGVLQELLFEIDDDTPADLRTELLADLENRFDAFLASSRVAFLAFVDGRPASAAQAGFLDSRRVLLMGGATRPWARGRGCYTALVHRRWELLRERGMEAFVVQASDMSMPILAGLGFRATATLSVLVDRPPLP